MSFTVLLCFLLTTLIPFCSTQLSKELRYECGPHGKFEYCIDGIPGCVIGCHCHPGFYFDTDTKICEPNMKLTQAYRRHNLDEPTRVHDLPAITPTAPVIPNPTATRNLDEKVREMTKETDELGDWLYNEFFKTIESQIINISNNTLTNSKEKTPTRRSGDSGAVIRKRRIGKSIRGGRKKKHKKRHGLRRKLLRITENDSLFDSKSGSDSSDTSSSSGSDSSSDTNTSDGNKSSGSDDKDHGHKKVIIFNRRPKPPLPSFIFLPGMNTPYYPPMGLPPPPLMPMYPMAPVPPMAPPMFPPLPGLPECDNVGSTQPITAGPSITTVDPTTTTVGSTTTTVGSSTTTDGSNTTSVDSSTTTIKAGDRRSRHEIQHRKKISKQFSELGRQRTLKHGSPKKLMQKIRNKIKGRRRNNLSPTDAELLEDFQYEELQNLDDVSSSSESFTLPKRLSLKNPEENYFPKLDDVDFKYLSELIHRVNQSNARSRLPPLPFKLNKDLKELQKLQVSQQTRKNFGSYNPMPQGNRQGTDDIYYSNLGRQIASMIRNADSLVDHQFNKDSEHANRQIPFHSVLNEKSYLPRSFWERSVRSPLPQKVPFAGYLDESRTLKHSDENSLVNLENEVEIFASTPPPLRLQDLENILSTVQNVHAHIQFKQPMPSTKQLRVNLNKNLLTNHVRISNTNSRLFDAPEKVEYFTEHYQTTLQTRVNIEMHPAIVTNTSVFDDSKRHYKIPYSNDNWMNSQESMQPRPTPSQTNNTSTIRGDNQIYNTILIKQPFKDVVQPKHTEIKKPREEYLRFRKREREPLTKQSTPKTREPKIVKYKSLNYFSGNNHYMFEAASYPFLSPFKLQSNKKISKPSYFHHLSHRFEYFD